MLLCVYFIGIARQNSSDAKKWIEYVACDYFVGTAWQNSSDAKNWIEYVVCDYFVGHSYGNFTCPSTLLCGRLLANISKKYS